MAEGFLGNNTSLRNHVPYTDIRTAKEEAESANAQRTNAYHNARAVRRTNFNLYRSYAIRIAYAVYRPVVLVPHTRPIAIRR